MRVARFAGADEFLARAGDFLAAREAEHNLLLGLSDRLRDDPHAYGEDDPYLAVAEEQDRIAAVALRTPPHNLLLSQIDDERACEALAEDAREVFASLPGVLGPVEGVARFVRAWEALVGQEGRLTIAERIYRAETAVLPTGVPGRLRPYAEADRARVEEWLAAFLVEALPDEMPREPDDFLDRRLADQAGGVVLWEDGGEVVSLSSHGNRTPNGIRIGPVYTPPELRGRGYASALVAEETRTLLAGGRRFCFLFTDLGNATSNSIYRRIGYQPVTDVDMWLLV